MNKLQIIEQIFGNKFTPYAFSLRSGWFFSAYPKEQNTSLLGYQMQEAMKKAEQHNCRIGVDFNNKCFDVYFKS